MTNVLTRDAREQGEPEVGASGTLHVRGAADSFMFECLRMQADARRQSRIAWLFGANPLTRGARQWYREALHESRNARRLRALGTDFTLLHATPDTDYGSGVDTLVIGPTGVFIITTKNHSGFRVTVHNDVLLVNTRRTHHIRDARYAASCAAKLINPHTDPKASEFVPVIPLIAIVDPRSLAFVGTRPHNLLVARSSQLARTITRRKRVIEEGALTRLVAAAERNGDWYADSRVVDDTFRHEAAFARLVERVDAAARRRALWVFAGVLALLAVVTLAIVVSPPAM